MELLEAFYRRKLRRKQRKSEPGRSDVAVVGRTQGALARTPSEASVSGLATGLISKVLRFTSRRNEPASRPHSWHSTKISDGERAPERRRMDTMGSGWQQGHHSSASTSDLSGGFESSSGYLRKSPDQYSSRGSMESLDPPPSAQLRPREQQYHPLVHSGHGGAHPAYSSCQQLSSARSSSSIDHLHSKRDSAYSSFSTSSSIPEYLAVPSSSPERSCSLEDVLHQGGGREEMQQADIRHVQTACGAPGLEPGSTPSSSSRRSRELQGLVGGVCYRSSSSGGTLAANRHSVGPIWAPATSHSSYESLKGAPAPPRRSDSYAAIKHHERPNSWSSLEAARSLQKGSLPPPGGALLSAKGSYSTEGQLHTVMEKSPESSPTTRPRQGGATLQPAPSPPGPSPESGSLPPPTGASIAPQPEPHSTPESSGAAEAEAASNRWRENGQQTAAPLFHRAADRGQQDRDGAEHQVGALGPQSPHGHRNHMLQDPDQEFQTQPRCQSSQRRDGTRSVELSSVCADHITSSRPAQGQAPPTSAPRHHGDPSALQWEQKEQRQHPLTRLEIALAEVQGCSPPRRLSVLEKVSRFERHEHGGKQRSSSSSSSGHVGWATHHRMAEKGRSAPCGAEDIRNMLERSTSGSKAHRALSFRGGSSTQLRTSADPSSALQRSRSSLHLEESREGDNRRDVLLRQDLQEMLGSLQDPSLSRSYKDSLKGVQSRVLRSTSFKRRDLLTSSPSFSSISSSDPPKPHPLEKKAPKTMPKPQGIMLPLTSPHAPRERHVISPQVRGPSPPALPSVPAVGPPALLRICGRKRLTADQKKRSYSEPENINEVGVSDAETTALLRPGGGEHMNVRPTDSTLLSDRRSTPRPSETSVADRRRMFEAVTRPDLRQLQHNALTEYVERKRWGGRDEGGRRTGPRPHSVYLQPADVHPPVSSPHPSLSSTSSLLSLQYSSSDQSLSSGERRHCSTRPPGDDPWNHQSNLFYPGRVTTPRPPVALQQQSSAVELQAVGQRAVGQQRPRAAPPPINGTPQTSESTLSCWKSVSAENLLEPTNQQHAPASPSSSTRDRRSQDVAPSDVGTSGVFSSGLVDTEDGPADVQASEILFHPQTAHGASPGPAHSAVTHRRRQRNSERQRAHSTSSLAASVGLPCPLGGGGWQAGDRLSLADLDGGGRRPRDSWCDGGVPEDGVPSENTKVWSLTAGTDRKRSEGAESCWPHTSVPQRHLSSLCISESSLLGSAHGPEETSSGTQDELDDVFLKNPPTAETPRETDITEESPPLPPPPPLPPLLPPPPEASKQQDSTISSPDVNSSPPTPPSTSVIPPPVPTVPPPVKPRPCTVPAPCPSVLAPQEVEDSLRVEYQPLSRREKTAEEQRVEALARQLVLHDGSLAPLLDTWGGKSTVELVEEIFQSKVPWQRRGSFRLDGRIRDGGDPAPSSKRGAHVSFDEDLKDLDSTKVALCEALRCSVVVLRAEREELQEEQQRHQALGASLDSVVQEHCRTNERDKYSRFIGDLEKVVNLLLSLCGRLSRIDTSLLVLQQQVDEDAAEERESLHHKRSLLLRQTEDAWELKENLDRRQRVVHAFLSDRLAAPHLQDYRRFVSTKPSLLIRQRNLDDLIRQREEQLARLAENLPPELAEARGWSRSCLFSAPSPAPCSSPCPPLIPGPAHLVRSTTVTSL